VPLVQRFILYFTKTVVIALFWPSILISVIPWLNFFKVLMKSVVRSVFYQWRWRSDGHSIFIMISRSCCRLALTWSTDAWYSWGLKFAGSLPYFYQCHCPSMQYQSINLKTFLSVQRLCGQHCSSINPHLIYAERL